MITGHLENQYAICIRNENYAASLEKWKLYITLPDEEAARHDMIRVIDESGEDYLYPSEFFTPIEVPESIKQIFSAAL